MPGEIARKVDIAWAVNTKKDFCTVDGKIVPFDIVCDLSKAVSYSANVNANSAAVLTVTHRIPGMVGNAGYGLDSGVSQLAGEVLLIAGSSTVFMNGKAGVRDGDPCLMNCSAAGKSNVEGKIYTSAVLAYRARRDSPVGEGADAEDGEVRVHDEPDPVLKDEYKSAKPGGYSEHIVDLQDRLRAADKAGLLSQEVKKSFLDEINAELEIAKERYAQLPNPFDPNLSAAGEAAHATLHADVDLLLDDRRRLDEMIFDATTVGKIVSVVELAMLLRSLTTLPRHLGRLGKWLRARRLRAKPPPPPPRPTDGLSVRVRKKLDPEALEQHRKELSMDPATKRMRPNEGDTALRVEEKQDVNLTRYDPPPGMKGDWVDEAGKVYDGCSPGSTQFFDAQINNGKFAQSLLDHVNNASVDFVIVDTTGLGLTAAQEATLNQIIGGLTPEQLAKIIHIP